MRPWRLKSLRENFCYVCNKRNLTFKNFHGQVIAKKNMIYLIYLLQMLLAVSLVTITSHWVFADGLSLVDHNGGSWRLAAGSIYLLAKQMSLPFWVKKPSRRSGSGGIFQMFINNVEVPEIGNAKRPMEIDGSKAVMMTMRGHWLTCDTVTEQHSKSFCQPGSSALDVTLLRENK